MQPAIESFAGIGQEVELYPELFPELEVRTVQRPPPRQTRVIAPRFSPVSLAPVATSPACFLRRDTEILDFFLLNSSTLRPFHIRQTREIAQRIIASLSLSTPIRSVTIVGHTDERGSERFNLELGEKRARAIASRLSQELGASASRVLVTAGSRGKTAPISPNSFERGRACNRRVQLFFNCPADGCLGRSFRNFFTEYDMRTFPAPPDRPFGIDANPNLTADQKAQRKADVFKLIPMLLARRNNRASAALGQPAATPIPALDLDAAKRLSEVQLQLFFESFAAPGNTLDLAAFRRAFYDFANGDLRTPEIGPNAGVGEPDSAAFFLFAEFAFLCIENGIRAQVWTEILPWFVSAQEIFIYVYRRAPHSAPPPVPSLLPPVCSPVRHPLSTYTFKNFDGKGQSSEQRKGDLFSKYNGMNLNQLKDAARENLLRAQCSP
jgi:outer membrane protein OmpA-like peptidoglycan-associated protein